MSSIYNLEPQPTASAIIHTTQGDLSVELWAKQAPLTCRNFLQLALDGYYDNTIFHRLVPGFILQGGDPTGTGNGGESIYDGGAFGGDLDPWPLDQRDGANAGETGVGFKDEFHSRLKFNRRGLLGMANESRRNTNGSQFFFTLDKTDELTNKNTLFGRIMGDTIYNLAKMGEAELTPGSERPAYPVKVTSVEILVNPFEDMKKRERVAPQSEKVVVVERKKKRKGGKQLLSFGDDDADGDSAPAPLLKKAKKFDTRIAVDLGVEEEKAPKKDKKDKKERKTAKAVSEVKRNATPQRNVEEEEEEEEEEKPQPEPKPVASRKREVPVKVESESPEPPEMPTRKSALEKTNEQIAALKATMKRSFDAAPVQETKKKSALEEMIPETSTRGRKRKQGGGGSGGAFVPSKEDKKTMSLLKAFQSKLEQAPAAEKEDPSSRHVQRGEASEAGAGKATSQADGEAELCDLHFIAGCESCKAWDQAEDGAESDDEGWMSRALSFKADKLGKDLSYRKKAEDELVVIDPREKARTLKEEKKAEREARAGNTGREWDQARNAQMAKSSSLAGRGAK